MRGLYLNAKNVELKNQHQKFVSLSKKTIITWRNINQSKYNILLSYTIQTKEQMISNLTIFIYETSPWQDSIALLSFKPSP